MTGPKTGFRLSPTTKGEVMIWEEDPVQSGLSTTTFGAAVSWSVINATGPDGEVAVGLYVETSTSLNRTKYVRPGLTLDDAEAIGYSLLYAVKLQRDKENGKEAT